MEFLLATAYAAFFIFLIRHIPFFRCDGLSANAISLVFIMKLLSGAALWAVYTLYYPYRDSSDSFKYFDDAALMYEALKTNPLHYLQMLTGINADAEHLMVYYNQMSHWFKPYDYGIYNDNRTVIRVIGLFYPFSLGYYAVQIVFFCFLSLFGLVAIFKTIYPYLKNKVPELAFAVFLLPSVLFWSSGVLKEGILMFGFGIFLFFFFRILFQKLTYKSLIWVAFSFLLLVLIKGYVLLALIPGILSLLLIRFSGNNYSGLKFLGVHLALLLFAINLYHLDPELDVLYFLHRKQRDFINVAELYTAGSYIKTQVFEPTWTSLITNTPEAVFNTLFRPTILEANTLLMIAAALENLLIIFICIFLLIFFRRPDHAQFPLFWFSVFFTLSLAAIIGIVTPVLGAVVRYKIPLLPFFLIIFLFLSDKEKMIKKIPFLSFLNRNRI